MAEFYIPTDKEIAEKTCGLIIADLSYNWSIQDLASESHVTVYTLRRIFKRQIKLGISDFIVKAKMEKAKELLITTNNTIQMIAETVGYVEGNNFQKRFKKITGKTPGEWRKNSGQL